MISENNLANIEISRNSKLIAFVSNLTKYGPNVLNTLGNLALTVLGAIVFVPALGITISNGILILVGFALISFIGNVLVWSSSNKKDKELEKNAADLYSLKCELAEKKKELDGYKIMSYDIVNNYLANLANDIFKLTDSDRISLFKVDSDRFIRIGRYSKNPDYKTKGRSDYPIDEGTIAQAWQKGEFFLDDIPDPNKKPRSWMRVQKKVLHVSPGVAQNLCMKCRCTYALAIEDPNRKNRIAVLSIESVKPKAINPDNIKRILDGSEYARLSELIFRIKDIVPDLRKAEEKGF